MTPGQSPSGSSGGLCIPLVTPLDADGRVAEEDLRALMRHLAPHAAMLFLCGTTGEWNRIGPEERRRVIALGVDEGRKLRQHQSVPVWVGVTAPTREETLANAALALELSADAMVIAPLAVAGLEMVRFFQRDLAGLFESKGKSLPVYLYDNADIAVDPDVPHMHTRDVKAVSRLEWVKGVKVTAGLSVLGNYTKAAENFRDDFEIFAGNPLAAFDIFRPRRGFLGTIQEHWRQYLLHDRFPVGVVAGTANLAPAHWKKGWAACRAGDVERMDFLRTALEALSKLSVFDAPGVPGGQDVKKSIACLKEGLRRDGVIRSGAVAPGTKNLTPEEAAAFGERFAAWKKTYGSL